MRKEHQEKFKYRESYIIAFRSKQYLEDKVMDWAIEFSEKYNHGKIRDPKVYMEKQVNYIYWKVTRLYRKFFNHYNKKRDENV